MSRDVPPDRHGTLTGYTYGCRCAECAECARMYRRARRAGVPASRGPGRPRTVSVLEQVCAHCGGTFSNRRLRTFCSVRCANDANNHARRFEDEPVPRRELLRRAGGLSQKSLRRIGAAWKSAGRQCAYCDRPAETADHLVPLIRGGENTLANLVPACLSCNSSKGARPIEEWRGVRRAS